MLKVNNAGQNLPSYEIKNKDYSLGADFKAPVQDVYSGSKPVQQNSNKDKLSFKAFIDLFIKRPPIVELKELAREAHFHSRPLEVSIYRRDFQEKISKNEIIQVLENEKEKADMSGIQERYNRLIKYINENY